MFFHGEDCFCCSQYFLNAHSSFCSVFPLHSLSPSTLTWLLLLSLLRSCLGNHISEILMSIVSDITSRYSLMANSGPCNLSLAFSVRWDMGAGVILYIYPLGLGSTVDCLWFSFNGFSLQREVNSKRNDGYSCLWVQRNYLEDSWILWWLSKEIYSFSYKIHNFTSWLGL